MEKILIAGGTGFVGKALTQHLVKCGYTVNVLTRRDKVKNMEHIKYFQWNIEKGFIDEKAFEGIVQIINLTGANISGKRWTKKRKVKLLESRAKAIDLLFMYVKTLNLGIHAFISSSATGYYGAITSDEHGVKSTHRSIEDKDDLYFAPNFNVKLANHFSDYRYTKPFFYGRFQNMALAYFFEPSDLIRFSQSPDGGGTGNPA